MGSTRRAKRQVDALDTSTRVILFVLPFPIFLSFSFSLTQSIASTQHLIAEKSVFLSSRMSRGTNHPRPRISRQSEISNASSIRQPRATRSRETSANPALYSKDTRSVRTIRAGCSRVAPPNRIFHIREITFPFHPRRSHARPGARVGSLTILSRLIVAAEKKAACFDGIYGNSVLDSARVYVCTCVSQMIAHKSV